MSSVRNRRLFSCAIAGAAESPLPAKTLEDNKTRRPVILVILFVRSNSVAILSDVAEIVKHTDLAVVMENIRFEDQ